MTTLGSHPSPPGVTPADYGRKVRGEARPRSRPRRARPGGPKIRRLLTTLAGITAALVTLVGSAGAIDQTIDLGGIVRGTPGDTIELATEAVDTDLIGRRCDLTLTGGNNDSTHPNNDLTVTTGPSSITFADIEAVANSTANETGTAILGSAITVTITLGADGVSSGGFALTVDCPPPATTTTSSTSTTLYGPPPTTLPPADPEPPTVRTPTFTG